MNPVRVLKGLVVVCRCRREDFASSINLKFGYVLQLGWNYPKKHSKISQNYFCHGFGCPKNAQNAHMACF